MLRTLLLSCCLVGLATTSFGQTSAARNSKFCLRNITMVRTESCGECAVSSEIVVLRMIFYHSWL